MTKMTNHELVQFAQTWRAIGSDAQEMIERIVEASHDELPENLLEDLDVRDLERALEELRCCNVPKLVRLVDNACQDARAYRRAVEIGAV